MNHTNIKTPPFAIIKDGDLMEDTSKLLRVLEFNYTEHEEFIDSLKSKGCYYARYGGFPPWEYTLPEKGDNVVFLHRFGNNAQLYMMHCIAVGDDDAAYFVDEKDINVKRIKKATSRIIKRF